MPHGYEAGGDIPTAPSLDDDGDAERRRKKVNRFCYPEVAFHP